MTNYTAEANVLTGQYKIIEDGKPLVVGDVFRRLKKLDTIRTTVKGWRDDAQENRKIALEKRLGATANAHLQKREAYQRVLDLLDGKEDE